MISSRTALGLLALIILPGSCIAAAPDQASSTSQKKSNTATPVHIGAFKLSRAPQQGGLVLGTAPPGTTRLVVDGRNVDVAADGRFIIGFGRDYAAATLVTAFLENGSQVTEKLPVQPTRWRIESLSSLPHHAQPDAEFQARRPGELDQINAARHRITDAQGWRQTFIWPVRGRITGHFGAQRIYRGEPGAPHAGVDISGATGTPVVAPADGVVILAATSPFTLEGNLLMLDHGMGLNSAFLHLSRIDVKPGDHVRQGQPIGAVGMSGRATGPHLHWGMKWRDERIDPGMLPAEKR